MAADQTPGIEVIQPAVAQISSPGFGTAFAVDSKTALTAFHCVSSDDQAGARPIEEEIELRFLSGQTVAAKVSDFNPLHDWALLRLDTPLSEASRPLPLTDQPQQAGDRCRCLGFPGRGEVGFLPILASVAGEISRTGVSTLMLEVGALAAGLDARGLSGAPVVRLDSHDAAVGLVSARLMDPEDEEHVGGVIFASPTRLFLGATLPPRDRGDRVFVLGGGPGGGEEPQDVGALARAAHLLLAAGEPDQARPMLERAARAGDPPAAYTLGLLLDPTGDLIDHDPAGAREAMAWFRRAATGGDVYGATTMGIRLHQQDRDDAALPWLEEAIERGGDAMAAHTLGRIHDRRHEFDDAAAWERFAAERGDVRAAYDLGRILNDCGERDEAIRWLQRATADPDALSLLRELGVEPDDSDRG